VIYERACFFRRCQQPEETVEQYVKFLNDISDERDFSNRSERMRDRIVVGITDTNCSREIQKMNIEDLTEEIAINMAWQFEQVDKNIKDLTESHTPSSTSSISVDAVSKVTSSGIHANNKSQKHNSRRNSTRQNHNTPCDRCAYVSYTRGTPPAKDCKCKRCGRLGYYAKMCK